MKPPWWVRVWYAYSTFCVVSVLVFDLGMLFLIVREALHRS